MKTSLFPLALPVVLAALILGCVATPEPAPAVVVTPAPMAYAHPAAHYMVPMEEIVLVTKTGKVYHRAHCTVLERARVDFRMTRKQAIHDGYRACRVCRPDEIN
jgi:hypothetical protein